MASQDPLPQAIDFLSQCERCHTMVGDTWLVNGEYICTGCYSQRKVVHRVHNYKKIELKYDNIVEKMTYGWTKWYGANNNLFVITPEWFCQSCQDKQTDELPSYLIRIQDQEYARICSICLNIAITSKINNIFDLMQQTRPIRADF